MSVRGSKRALSRSDEGGCKRRRTDTDDSSWQPRPLSDLKISTIYNRSAPEAPAELFRKDLISAMKLPDSEPLTTGNYWIITDSWRQEWERGVQVPVNPDSLPEPAVTIIKQTSAYPRSEFKLPKQKYVRLTKDANFSESEHYLSNPSSKNESTYDLDACDLAWLKSLNGERARAGAHPIREDQLERVIEELEVRCWDKIQAILKSEEGLGIEYDENVICDVCRSPDSEEGNEMVFCDSCNICVHQACYGITAIPSGQWLCSPCAHGVQPAHCVLCPNLGGAMKCTPAGQKWAHVSCVLWIPEVSIGCAERMEPITKISAIPTSRWSLVCVLCKERTGACIQCSVRTCKIAYHVTCAFKHALEMRAIIEDENADDGVKLRSYCQKHSVNCKKENRSTGSGSEEDDNKRKRRKDMTSEEKSQARALRLHEIEAEFDKHVSIKDISTHLLDVDQDGIQYIYNYWKLKRKSGHNRPLLPPKADENDILTDGQGQADLDKKKMFVQLRQDLERVRNLCYMVSRREKFSRSFFRMREQTFHKQVAVLSGDTLTPAVMTAVIEANHGPSIYDRLYSHPNAADHTADFENLLIQIAGIESGDEKKKDLNGLVKGSKSTENPYRRLYINGSARRSASYSGISSGAESIPDRDTKFTRSTFFTTDEEDKPSSQQAKKRLFSKDSNSNKLSVKKKSRRLSRSRLESSSEEDLEKIDKRNWPKSRTLRQMELEMGDRPLSESDSDELMPIRSTKTKLPASDIYSDSENSDNNKHEDSQQHTFRTKAAVKEFIPLNKGENKGENKNTKRSKKTNVINKAHVSDEEVKDKENIKSSKNKENPTDLIVPQREAAKKASENMRTNTSSSKREQSDNSENKISQPLTEDSRSKGKPKVKDKKDSREQLKEANKKDRKSSTSDVFENEKHDAEKDSCDLLAYVPQRKAAKKAAEHIKSGMTKVPGSDVSIDDAVRKKETLDIPKSPKKEDEKKSKSSSKSSPGSPLSSSNSSSSSSSSSEAEDEVGKVSCNRSTEKSSMVKSLFSSPKRRNDDLPFLDKGSKITTPSCPSSDSESKRKDSKNSSMGTTSEKKQGTPQSTNSKTVSRKTSDKKPKITNEQLGSGLPEGEKSSGTNQQVSRASTRARTRSSTSGARDLFDTSRTRKQKQDSTSQENNQSSQLSPTQWKTDKKIKQIKKDEPEDISPTKKQEKVEEKPEHTNTSKIKQDEVSHSPKRINTKDKENILSQKSLSPFPPSPNTSHKQDIFKTSAKSPEIPLHRHLSANNEQCKVEVFEMDTNIDSDKIDKDTVCPIEKSVYKSPNKLFSSKNAVKSPKTLENKVSEPCEGQTPKLHAELNDNNSRITNLVTDDKVSTFEIVPPEFNDIHEIDQRPFSKPPPFHNHSIFSPQPVVKDSGCELFDIFTDETFINMNIAQSNEEIMKAPPLTLFGSDFLFKEDSKEDSVRETLNLVEKLRMQMSSKKPTSGNQNDSRSSDLADDKDQTALHLFNENDNAFKNRNITEDCENIVCNEEIIPSKTDITHEKSISEDIPDKADFVITNVAEDKSHANNSMPVEVKEDTPFTNQDENKTWEADSTNFKEFPDIAEEKDLRFSVNHSESQNSIESVSSQNKIESIEGKFLQGDDKHYDSHIDNSTNSDIGQLQISTSQSIDVNLSSESHPNYESTPLQAPECTPIPSPFNSMRAQPKWAESELIPARRSSTSSSASDMSLNSLKRDDNDQPSGNSDQPSVADHENSDMLQNMSYDYHPCPIETNSYNTFASEASQFVGGPVSLFPSTTSNSQIPLSTRSTALFPPNVSLPYPNTNSLMPHVPKSSEESLPFSTPCGAAFTSSSHNMAITTAMVAPQTPKGSSEHSPAHEVVPEMTVDNSYNQQSPVSLQEFTSNTSIQNQVVSEKGSTPTSESPSQGKKSPSKPTRTSSRFVSQQGKSPGKSPGKSKQMDTSNKLNNRRGSSKSCRGSRTRGRPRGNHMHGMEYFTNTIHTKLVGTVYDLDFDEDIADLKPMRERRKSADVHDRKCEGVFRDSPHSPNFTSPSQHSQSGKRSSYSTDVRDLRPPTPISDLPPAVETSKSPVAISTPVDSSQQSFTNIVQPVLPGPVDMRTYSAFEPSIATDAFSNHLLGAFASGTADQQLHDIDEEMEKEFHSQLMASSNKSQEALSNQDGGDNLEKSSEEVIPNHEPTIPKVSLSDSRNQLKVKIKGPFLDANYSSSITPSNQQPNAPIEQSSGIQMLGAPSAVSSVTSAMISGTSNLRRMRKKELLRQYCTQENMDDPVTANVINQVSQPAPVNTFNRTVITIPKAVASMTSFPTKEDYKAVVDANTEKKRRKISNSLGHGVSIDELLSHENRSTSDNAMLRQLAMSYKRKGRISKPLPNSPSNNIAAAPKLKIKIRNYMSTSSLSNNPKYDPDVQFKPPKKRLTSIPKPSVEDLRRESMKFRKMVFADFEESKKEKKKRVKTEKRKKKRDKRSPEMHVVNNKPESATKLIIRIARKKEEASKLDSDDESLIKTVEKAVVPVDPYDYDPSAPDPLAIDSPLSLAEKPGSSKVSPIRLKLSRGAGGSGYIMKDSSSGSDEPIACSIPSNKHCQVR